MTVLRWILILPAAALAAVLANLLVIFWEWSSLFIPMSPRWVQFASSIIGGYAFVFVGAIVAPTQKKVVSIVLALLFAIYAVAVVVFTIRIGPGSDPLWWVIVCLVAATVAATVACVQIVSGYEDV